MDGAPACAEPDVQRDRGWLDRRRLGGGLVGFQIFQPQFELFDVTIELLRARAELHALQLEDEQLQILDLGVAGIEFGLLWPAPALSAPGSRARRDRAVVSLACSPRP